MMMDSSMMAGNYGSGMMLFGWLAYILVIVLIVLAIVALLKYIKK